MSLRVLLSIVLLGPVLMGCGDHTSSAGPRASTTGDAQAPATRRPAVPEVAAARLSAWRLPFPVARAVAIPMRRGSVVLAGGLLAGDRSSSRAFRLDPRTGVEHALPSLTVPVHDAAGGLVAGAPTVVGGGNSAEQSAVQTLAPGGWRRVADLPTTRSDLGVAEWQGTAYVIGGYDGASVPRTILRLSPHQAPRRAGALLDGVRYAAMARIGSDVYVLGGEVAGRELDSIQKVDLATGRTRPAGRLRVALGHAMAVPVAGRILVMGGRVAPYRQTDAMWWYDPASGHLRRAGRLPMPLSDAAVATYGRRIWLLGGETPGITDRVVAVGLR
ncbi:MAG TPA: hypothetical protein VGK78_02410 [Nocardioides sp.]|uniref:Kelch repeat-containing protein n=1 Tax=Nocardioides sp. TaxID=35761 RepID=UPI002F4117B0